MTQSAFSKIEAGLNDALEIAKAQRAVADSENRLIIAAIRWNETRGADAEVRRAARLDLMEAVFRYRELRGSP